MRRANIYCRGIFAGVLSKSQDGRYEFLYAPEYVNNPHGPAISLTLPKQNSPFTSTVLFPFFFGLLAEGEDKATRCRALKIDENDHFSQLLKTCGAETVGGVTVKESDSP